MFDILRQFIWTRFNGQLDIKDIHLRQTDKFRVDNENTIPFTFYNYAIMLKNLKIGVVYTSIFDNGVKTVNLIKVDPMFRNKGVGRYVLTKFFHGAYLWADNPDASRLYARIGKPGKKFSRRENLELQQLMGYGVYKV